MLRSRSLSGASPAMMRSDAKVEKVYLYTKPVDFRKSIDGLAALVELDIKVAVFDPVLFVFLNKFRTFSSTVSKVARDQKVRKAVIDRCGGHCERPGCGPAARTLAS